MQMVSKIQKQNFISNLYSAQQGAINIVNELLKKDPNIQLGDTEFNQVKDTVEVLEQPTHTETNYVDIDDGQAVP